MADQDYAALEVTATADWTAEKTNPEDDWFRLLNTRFSAGYGYLEVYLSRNETGEMRTGTVTLTARDNNGGVDTSCAMMPEDLSTVPGWGESEEFYYFTLGEPAAVFPLGGYRDDYEPLSYSKMGYRVEYWLGSTYANNSTGKLGNAMRVRTASSGNRHQISGVPKARGCYIRCVAE